MTFFRQLETTAFSLVNEREDGGLEPVVELSLSECNDGKGRVDANGKRRGRIGRLHVGFKGDYASEIEIEPGPDHHPKGNIVGQIMQWGPTTPDGNNRNRITTSIVADKDGGLSGVIDSSTNDPSGSEGQSHAMPLVFNAGEGKGVYVALYPSDNTIDFQDRAAGVSTGRITVASLIKHLRRIPK